MFSGLLGYPPMPPMPKLLGPVFLYHSGIDYGRFEGFIIGSVTGALGMFALVVGCIIIERLTIRWFTKPATL